jgi:hypothetical protein
MDDERHSLKTKVIGYATAILAGVVLVQALARNILLQIHPSPRIFNHSSA